MSLEVLANFTGSIYRRTFLRFLYDTNWDKKAYEVPSRQLESVVLPVDAYGFEFYDRLYLQVALEYVTGGVVTLGSKPMNRSKTHYCKARVMNEQELTQLNIRCPHRPTFVEQASHGLSFVKLGARVLPEHPLFSELEELLACNILGAWNRHSEFVDVKLGPPYGSSGDHYRGMDASRLDEFYLLQE